MNNMKHTSVKLIATPLAKPGAVNAYGTEIMPPPIIVLIMAKDAPNTESPPYFKNLSPDSKSPFDTFDI